jgi:hypothetical protein
MENNVVLLKNLKTDLPYNHINATPWDVPEGM